MAEFINVKENEIDVKYGLFNLREERDSARHSLKYIIGDVKDLKQSYIRLGFHLSEFKNSLFYEDFGYDNFYEFCSVNLGLEKSSVKRLIGVWWNFSATNDNSTHLMAVDEKYSDYSYTQLVEMLPLSDKERKNITPDMTQKQIREYKKKLKTKKSGALTHQVEKQIDEKIENGDFIADLTDYLDKYLKKNALPFSYNLTVNNKNVYMEIDNKKYRLTLFCPKEEKKGAENEP